MADFEKDRLGNKLRDLEQAREDLFFAERDRQLIEKLRAEQSETWHAEVDDLMALVRAVTEGKVPLDALRADQAFLDAAATKERETLAIPGVRAVKGPAR